MHDQRRPVPETVLATLSRALDALADDRDDLAEFVRVYGRERGRAERRALERTGFSRLAVRADEARHTLRRIRDVARTQGYTVRELSRMLDA